MIPIIIIGLAVVGVGLYFLSSGIGLLGWILIIGGGIFALVILCADYGKIKVKVKTRPSKSSTYSYSSSSSSSSSDISSYASEIRDYVKFNVRSLSGIYWEDVDESYSGDTIYITAHYKKKDSGYNYVVSDRDVMDAVGSAVSSAISKHKCPYDVSYDIVCDEVYTSI